MADTIDRVAHELLLHCPLAGKPLATLWSSNAFSRLADLAEWSWRTRFSQFVIPDVYSSGSVSVSSADPTLIIGTGTVFTPEMVGRQFRIGTSFGYDVVEWIDATHIRISLPWASADVANQGYSIYQQYVTPPEDFQSFISVIDPIRNYKIRTGVERREIDRRDARRTTTGIPYVLAEAGYGAQFAGSVDATPIVAVGAGVATPYFSGVFNGPADALFVVEITTGGAVGTAVFRWKRSSPGVAGSYTSGVPTSTGAIGLSDNVNVFFPDTDTQGNAANYTLGDVFVARARSVASFGIPRYELWPTQLALSTYPFYYLAQIPDLTSVGATLPRGIRRDVVLKGALAEAANWKGRGEVANPMYDPKNAAQLRAEFERMVDVLALRDDDIFPKQVSYYHDLPFAGPPWDSSWEQRHA